MNSNDLALANSILKKVVRLTGVPADVLLSRRDGKRTEHARRLAYIAMAEVFSNPDVGAFFNRSSSTIWSVINKASEADRATALRWLTEVQYMKRRRATERAFEQLDIDYVDLSEAAL